MTFLSTVVQYSTYSIDWQQSYLGDYDHYESMSQKRMLQPSVVLIFYNEAIKGIW